MNVLEIAAAKVLSAIGGSIGGGLLLIFSNIKNYREIFLRGLVSTVSGALGASPLVEYLNRPKYDPDWILPAGAVIGFCAWFVLSAAAKFMIKRKDKDALEILKNE